MDLDFGKALCTYSYVVPRFFHTFNALHQCAFVVALRTPNQTAAKFVKSF